MTPFCQNLEYLAKTSFTIVRSFSFILGLWFVSNVCGDFYNGASWWFTEMNIKLRVWQFVFMKRKINLYLKRLIVFVLSYVQKYSLNVIDTALCINLTFGIDRFGRKNIGSKMDTIQLARRHSDCRCWQVSN